MDKLFELTCEFSKTTKYMVIIQLKINFKDICNRFKVHKKHKN